MYDQTGIKIDRPDQTVLDFISKAISENDSILPDSALVEARRLLQKFDFPSSRWSQRLPMLSGGERRRLQLLTVLSKNPNFLILDEPSVDLDISTLQALEMYLSDEYKGVLLVVSHDRYFADKVTDHLFLFEGDGLIRDFTGSLSEYASCLVEIENNKLAKPKETTQTTHKEDKAQRNAKSNRLRQAKREMVSTEKKIERFKQDVSVIEGDLEASAGEGWTVLAELTEKLDAANAKIEDLETKWLELAEEVEVGEAA